MGQSDRLKFNVGCWLLALLALCGVSHAQVVSQVSFYEPEPPVKPPTDPPKEMRLKPTDRAPVIDGELTDSCWQQAEPFEGFVLFQRTTPIQEQREVRMVFDRDNLYVAVRLEKQSGYELRTQIHEHDDTHMWKDDEFELFLDPSLSYDTYYQIIVNAAGYVCDLHHRRQWQSDPAAADPRVLKRVRITDDSWTSGVEVAVGHGEKEDAFWTIEMRLPIQSMGLPAIPLGARFGINMASNNPRTGELGNWAPGEWHDPYTYGQVVLGPPLLAVDSASFGRGGPGSGLFGFTAHNPSDQPSRYQTRIEGEGVRGTTVQFSLEADERRTIACPYTVIAGAESVILLAQITDEQDRLLFQAQRRIVPAPLLELEVKPYGYLQTDPVITGRFATRIGELEMPHVQLILRREGPSGNRKQVLPLRASHGRFQIETRQLEPGRHRLEAELVNSKGRSLASKAVEIAISDSPFAVHGIDGGKEDQ